MSLGNNPDELLNLIRSKWSDLVAEQMWGQNSILVREGKAKKPLGLVASVTQEDVRWKSLPRGATMEEMANIAIHRQPFKPNPEMQALVDRVTSRVQEDFEQRMAEEIGQLFRTGRSVMQINTTTVANTQEQPTALTREHLDEAYRACGLQPIRSPFQWIGSDYWENLERENFGEGEPIEVTGYYEGVDGGMTIQEIIEKWKKKGDQHAGT